MQSMQRQFGKLWNKAPGDNAKVSVLLNDYEDADKVLAKLIDNSKGWRDSWVTLVHTQLAMVTEYEGLYDPIVGATDGHGRDTAPTPELQLRRTFRLREIYAELKEEMMLEITDIEPRIIKPATEARDCIQPIRKTIKKRENKRLDYEKQQDKVNKLSRKPSKSPKEDAQLAKAEQEMVALADEFHVADDHLRETLPPIIATSFSIIPPLLACHVSVQTKLMGLYYTLLNSYCEEQGFPSPPPPMERVVADWSANFKPAQQEIESIGCVARGKVVQQPMRLTAEDGQAQQGRWGSLMPGQNGGGPRRSSTGLVSIPSPGANGNSNANNGSGGRQLRIPSTHSLNAFPTASPDQPPGGRRPSSPGFSAHLKATDFTTASVLGQPAASPGLSPNSLRSPKSSDYFGNRPQQQQQQQPPAAMSPATTYSPVMSPGAGAGAGRGGGTPGVVMAKKKAPPPPPPPKRVPSNRPDEFVVAQYDFPGEGQGDLSFREGDRIRIVRKTDTEQDWWVGEVNGRRGNFPANYCRAI